VSYVAADGTAAGCNISVSAPSTLSTATPGTCTLRATKAGDGDYLPVSSAASTVTIAKEAQAPLVVTSVSGPFGAPLTLTTSGGTGSATVTYLAGNGTATGCTVRGSAPAVLHSSSPGTCIVTATKATDLDHLAVSSAPTTVTLTQTTPSAPLGAGMAEHVLASGLNVPGGVTTNAFGDVFVANENAGDVVEYSPAGAVLRTVTAAFPTSVAVDLSGNLFVAEPFANTVLEVTPGGTRTSVGSVGDWSLPQAVATDSSGNLYVANDGNGELDEITPAGVITTAATGLNQPQGMTVNSNGGSFDEVYVANAGNHQLLEISYGTKIAIGSGFSDPVGVGLDAAGNVYVGDAGLAQVIRIAPAGTQTVIGAGFSYVGGLAADPFGHVDVADAGANVIDQLSGAPRATIAAVGAVKVTWAPPLSHGTTAISHYTATAIDATNSARGGQSCTYAVVTPATNTCTLVKLTGGDTYTFTVTATNGSGVGPPSAPTNAVIPTSPPSVTSVSPNAGPVAGGTPITVTGSGFVSGAKVVIGTGTKATTATNVVVVSSTKITAKTGVAAASGKLTLYVTANGATSAASAGAAFTYTTTPTSLPPAAGRLDGVGITTRPSLAGHMPVRKDLPR
jgi:hypothetical protein